MKRHLRSLITSLIVSYTLATALPASAADLLPDKLPDGFTRTKAVAYYNQENLYELINGQAVFYLSYGFTKLNHAFYAKNGKTYKVDVYEVKDDLSALGCFREQKDEESESLAVGAEGYITDYMAAFYKGTSYIEIVPEDEGDVAVMKALAAQVATILPGTTGLPRALTLFPKEGLNAGSETFFGEDLLSYTFLGRGLSADYDQAGSDRKLRLFISFAASPEAAQEILKTFTAQLTNAAPQPLKGATAGNRGELPYRGMSALFVQGKFAFGAIGIADMNTSLPLLERFATDIAAYAKQ